MNPQGLTPLEYAVIDVLLRTDHPVFYLLRESAACRVTGREYTGVGFFTDLSVPSSVIPAAVGRLVMSNVRADLAGLDHGAGFLLWVEEGRLTKLEGFSYDEPWPEDVGDFQVFRAPGRGNETTDLELAEAEGTAADQVTLRDTE